MSVAGKCYLQDVLQKSSQQVSGLYTDLELMQMFQHCPTSRPVSNQERNADLQSLMLADAGEDIPQEAKDSVAAGFRWRIRCTCEYVGTNPAEELQDELKRTIGFYGDHCHNGCSANSQKKCFECFFACAFEAVAQGTDTMACRSVHVCLYICNMLNFKADKMDSVYWQIQNLVVPQIIVQIDGTNLVSGQLIQLSN